jgi:diaminopimelate epimerase
LAVISFVKMHGIGNDYVYLDAVGDPSLAERTDLSALARAMSDRHTGIGSDGLILVCLPTAAGAKQGAHVRMRMFNADGSEGVMCGNGVRCVAKFAHDRLGFTASPLRVETGRGVLEITYTTDETGRLSTATVDMGEPLLTRRHLTLNDAELRGDTYAGLKSHAPVDPLDPQGRGYLIGQIAIPGSREPLAAVLVSMGNPHAVITLDDHRQGDDGSDGARAARDLGPMIERHPGFPGGINVHFVKWVNPGSVKMWTWERGSGITQACGTGACAVAVAMHLQERTDRDLRVDLPGGTLNIRWDEKTNHVFMTGPAANVCTGQWPTEPPPVLATIPTLTTERLILRPMTHADAQDVAALAGDKRISDMTLTVPHPYKPEHANAWISTHAVSHTTNINTVWAMTDKATGELVGTIGLVYNRHNGAEVGYWTGVPFWGKGYASEALGAVLAYAFEQRTPPLQRVDAHHFFGNDASGKVMQNAGMVSEGQCLSAANKHGEPLNVMRYAITREQWEGHRNDVIVTVERGTGGRDK